jgi:16S rRNA (cytosine1402-N4)-methyltransferase
MVHIPVLLKETVEGLQLKTGMVVLDATLGGGGHTKEICKAIGKDGLLIGIDADKAAIGRVAEILKDKCRFHLFVANFRELSTVLQNAGVPQIDAAMFDLGLSSFQLEESRRGFTFQKDEPLLMTFAENAAEGKLTAKEILNEWAEESIADVIYGYGGERYARRIASAIVESRKEKSIETTFQLVAIIERAVPAVYKRRKIHFATKTFQALRITVNDEIGSVKKAIEDVWGKLKVGGRVAVVSFHEIEDRAVKNFFRNRKQAGDAELITKKPIVPSDDEILENPRSRSAKLRLAEKINASI